MEEMKKPNKRQCRKSIEANAISFKVTFYGK